MANNWLPGLLGFSIFAVLVFIAINIVSNNRSNENSGGSTVIIPSWNPWRPRPTPRPTPRQHLIGGCAGTRYGCCSNGTTAKKDAVGSNCLLY